ncbi:MAG TPA: GGDEF domain-containing protein [Polyangiaceae bacterium]|jgi:diguanylate cyclase (GGDEF)-like protein|nr:GGDEF domain-containing protein [Polyangiaceae bacterium]
MADDPREKSAARRGVRLKTAPFSAEGEGLREQLQRELRKTVAPSLAVILGPDVGARVVLRQSVETGRDPACELPLHDDNVSWRHARIEDRGCDEWAIVDLGSTNGTLLNGQPCAGAILKPGDRIFIGKTVIEMQRDPLRDAQAAEIDRLLSIDDLSGLWVRRRFDAQLEASVAAVLVGTVGALSLVVMDMDGVKAINDTHGHAWGAFAIGETGRVMARVIGQRGFATRFGGDEFAAAFPGVAKEAAVAIAEEMRAAVGAHVYEHRGVRLAPGLSCGVASLPGDAADAKALFQAADEAMYRAKRAGKNRVAT